MQYQRLPCDLGAGGSLRLLSLGHILPGEPAFRDKLTLFPVGYTAQKRFASYLQVDARIMYLCTIGSELTALGHHVPVFTVTAEDDPEGIPARAHSPQAAWKIVQERVNQLLQKNGRPLSSATWSGKTLYGLSNPDVIFNILSLPGATEVPGFYEIKPPEGPQTVVFLEQDAPLPPGKRINATSGVIEDDLPAGSNSSHSNNPHSGHRHAGTSGSSSAHHMQSNDDAGGAADASMTDVSFGGVLTPLTAQQGAAAFSAPALVAAGFGPGAAAVAAMPPASVSTIGPVMVQLTSEERRKRRHRPSATSEKNQRWRLREIGAMVDAITLPGALQLQRRYGIRPSAPSNASASSAVAMSTEP
jgi:hypothetical protein